MKKVRKIFSTVIIIALIATNVMTLANSKFYDALYGALSKIPYSARFTKNSPMSVNKRLASENKKLKVKQARVKQGIGKVKKISSRISRRALKNVSTSVAAVPAESLPYVGIGAVLALTALDIKDACETMKDMDGLLAALGESDNSEDTAKVCGQEVPGYKYAVSQIKVTGEAYREFQENLGGFMHHVKNNAESKWNIIVDSVSGTMYEIINE